MRQQRTRGTASTALVLGLALALTTPGAVADEGDEEDLSFDPAFLFFELNHTDGDLGIHGTIGGDPWKRLHIEDANGRTLLDLVARNALRRQGKSEIAFESAEPTFDELPPAEFFRRFPEGTYEIEGRATDGAKIESEVEVTHVMPAPAVPTVNGEPLALECDPEEDGYDAPLVSAPVTIAWDPVTMSHATIGTPDVAVDIVNYEVVVEVEVDVDVDGEPFTSEMSIVLPPGGTEMSVPAEFLAQGSVFKYEVLARGESHNQTAVESCFVLE